MRFILNYKALILCALLYVWSSDTLKAQQSASFPEYNFNPFIINPAFAGLLEQAELTVAYTGVNAIEGGPRNFNFSGHTPLADGKMGIGGGIIRDEIGVTSSTNAFMAYSYKIFFDFKEDRPYWQNYQPGSLSFGITAGVLQFQDNLLDLGISDDIRFSENINTTIPTVGAGFLFNHSRFYVGVSAPNIIGTLLATEEAINIEFPVYAYMGYRFYNNRFKNLILKPSVLLRHENGAPLLIDLNTSISFKNSYELGAGYRSNGSFNFLAGLYFAKSFRFIYHFNSITNNSPMGSTHGLVLSYRFDEGYSN
ncbi:MAG: PorP/SprF family type IX secretion system membrane protein [Winogradskyella sp.]|uniref:PorP/SprF family type IX secretion system membrane protein n=1 Tax=Winogradskyella sp. TaxID=1883156 RepID=UPI00385ED90F